MRRGVLYRLLFPSGKQYIGITSQHPRTRFNRHILDARRGKDWPVSRAIRKYGRDAIRLEVLVIADMGYLKELERRAIEQFGTLAPVGYNVSPGGDLLFVNQRENALRQWANPASRSAIVAGMREANARPDTRANRRAAAARNRDRRVETIRRIWADPDRRRGHSALVAAGWTPEKRARHAKTMRESWLRRKQEAATLQKHVQQERLDE